VSVGSALINSFHEEFEFSVLENSPGYKCQRGDRIPVDSPKRLGSGCWISQRCLASLVYESEEGEHRCDAPGKPLLNLYRYRIRGYVVGGKGHVN